MNQPVVDINGLWVSLNGDYILQEIDLKIQEGVFLGLIGPNGGGKTTLLQTILGLVKPSRGRVRVFGVPPGHRRSRGRIGYLPQRAYADLSFPVTALDVAMMGRYSRVGLWRRPSAQDRQRVLEKLAAVEMDHLKDRPIGQLSGGEQQRVFIARALASEPSMLLLDEPTSGVDSKAQDAFYRFLGKLKQELSLTIVLVSHDIGVIPYHTDEIACLNRELHLHGSCPDVLDGDVLRRVYGCEVELLVHGKIPHRVIGEHDAERI
jgi:zinc transport system ATP-binding protein